jgi:heterotetrameric sarcosine oxidase gamma subunit
VPDVAALPWTERQAWDGLIQAGRLGLSGGAPGLNVTALAGLGLASVIVRDGQGEALRSTMRVRWAIEPPNTPRVGKGNGCDLVWSGPGQWLAVSGSQDIAVSLAAELGGIAAVTDQSDGRAMLRISGPRARDVLAKGCAVDLHSRVFRTGDAALTAIAYVGVHLWQVDDSPTYDFAVPRSMAGSFWSWLAASAAEFGCEIARPNRTDSPGVSASFA